MRGNCGVASLQARGAWLPTCWEVAGHYGPLFAVFVSVRFRGCGHERCAVNPIEAMLLLKEQSGDRAAKISSCEWKRISRGTWLTKQTESSY